MRKRKKTKSEEAMSEEQEMVKSRPGMKALNELKLRPALGL